jgi:hypothetical protein
VGKLLLSSKKTLVMKNFTFYKSWRSPALFLLSLFIFSVGCKKISIDKDDLRNFQQVNLVANSSVYAPVLTDVTLLNAWDLPGLRQGLPG